MGDGTKLVTEPGAFLTPARRAGSETGAPDRLVVADLQVGPTTNGCFSSITARVFLCRDDFTQ